MSTTKRSPSYDNPAIPPGSLVVVSGATGYIGSHIVEQTLAAGYRVRGTTRDRGKAAWAEEHFNGRHGSDRFELVEVKDMSAPNGFDGVVQGAAGFIHVANDMSKSSDPEACIQVAIDGVLNAARAAAKAGATRFVYTSSSFAVTQPRPNQRFNLTQTTWNETAIQVARLPNPDGESLYAAGKTRAEQELWKWANNDPAGKEIVVNTICPNANIGSPISPKNQGWPTTSAWVKNVWDSNYAPIEHIAPQHFVDVVDDAKLHVIALVDPDVKSERLFGTVQPFKFQDIVEILRKHFPNRSWKDLTNMDEDLSVFEPRERAEELLTRAYGRGFKTFEESVLECAKVLSSQA